jgi:hypothetical protein
MDSYHSLFVWLNKAVTKRRLDIAYYITTIQKKLSFVRRAYMVSVCHIDVVYNSSSAGSSDG